MARMHSPLHKVFDSQRAFDEAALDSRTYEQQRNGDKELVNRLSQLKGQADAAKAGIFCNIKLLRCVSIVIVVGHQLRR